MKIIREPDASLKRLLPPVSPRPDINYISSRYALPFECGGRKYVFHTLTRQCIEGVVPASAKAGEGHDDLIMARFLVPEKGDESVLYSQISSLLRTYTHKKGVRSYTILPTFGCNARCTYCYEEGAAPVWLTPETADQVVKYITCTHGNNKVKLAWFGGEPLLGIPVIDRICRGLRQAGLEYRSSMTSNGSLITPGVVEKMTGDWKLDYIQISMDGAEQDYISRKQYSAYGDYFHRVMKAVSDMSAAGIRVTIRCNVDEENWERIPEFLEELRLGIGNKEKVGIYFAPLNHVRMGEGDLAMWKKILDAGYLIEEAGLHRLPYIVRDLKLRAGFCMADGGGLVICPDGSLYPCEHCPEGSRFGDIWQGVTDEAARKEFCRTDRIREKCRTCPFLPDCTGFASCPVQDTHCRKVREMIMTDFLRRMVEKTESGNTEGETPDC